MTAPIALAMVTAAVVTTAIAPATTSSFLRVRFSIFTEPFTYHCERQIFFLDLLVMTIPLVCFAAPAKPCRSNRRDSLYPLRTKARSPVRLSLSSPRTAYSWHVSAKRWDYSHKPVKPQQTKQRFVSQIRRE